MLGIFNSKLQNEISDLKSEIKSLKLAIQVLSDTPTFPPYCKDCGKSEIRNSHTIGRYCNMCGSHNLSH